MSPSATGNVCAWMWTWGALVLPGVTNPGDLLALGDLLPDANGDAALTEVSHHQVAAAADVDHQRFPDGWRSSTEPIGWSEAVQHVAHDSPGRR